jgi:hypothetical protein
MLVMSFFILFQFALLYKGIIRGFCFSLTGLKSNSVYTISWSEIPGMVSVLGTFPGLFYSIAKHIKVNLSFSKSDHNLLIWSGFF